MHGRPSFPNRLEPFGRTAFFLLVAPLPLFTAAAALLLGDLPFPLSLRVARRGWARRRRAHFPIMA